MHHASCIIHDQALQNLSTHYTIPGHVKYSCVVATAMLGLQAEGTTLGADNGIGVAAALALLDMPTSAKLPPLECLFTIDEETGLTGMWPGPATQCSLHA